MSRITKDYIYTSNKDISLPVKWTSPEALEKKEFSIQSDIWSFGIVLWEIFSFGTEPYSGLNNKESYEKTKEGYRMPNPNENFCSFQIYSLMTDCWKNEPNERITFEQIFEKIENEEIILGEKAYEKLIYSSKVEVFDNKNEIQENKNEKEIDEKEIDEKGIEKKEESSYS